MRARASLLAVAIAAGCSANGENPYFDAESPFDVIETVPANGATGVPITVVIEAEFGGEVDPSTARDSIHVRGAGSATDVPGTATYDARVLRFDPTAVLQSNLEYTVTIDPGIPDSSGRALDGETWTFTTRGAVAPTAPVTRVPAPGRNGVPPNFLVRVSFNEALKTPIPTNAITMLQGASAFNGSTIYDAASRSLVFRPVVFGTPTSTMTVNVDVTNLRDVNDQPLPAIASWTFDLANPEDSAKPVLPGPLPSPAETPIPPPAGEDATLLLDPPAASDAEWADAEILYEAVVSRVPVSDAFGPCDDPFEPSTRRVGAIGAGAIIRFTDMESGQWSIVLEAEDGSGRRSTPLGPGAFDVIGRVVAFDANVKPVLVDRCAFEGCHANPTDPGRIDLSESVTVTDLQSESSFLGLPQVQPFCLEKSYLWRKVSGGYVMDGGLMPPSHVGVNALSRSEIDMIRRWIEQGAN